MSATAQIILWGIAASAPVVLAYVMHKLAALGLATMLLLGWCFGRVLGALYSPPESMAFYPLMDLLFGVLAYASWRQQHERWKLVLIGTFIGQCAAHAAFWIAQAGATYGQNGHLLYRYVLTNNVLFGLELLTVLWAGGLGDLARRFSDRLFGQSGPRGHVGASG